MATLKVSKKSLTKYSTLYRWNGYFGHLSEVIKNHKCQFWTFWTIAIFYLCMHSVMTLTLNAIVRRPEPLTKTQI
jgi:hypothetical protein